MRLPQRIELADPEPLLAWLETSPHDVDLDGIAFAQVWGLVGLAAMARRQLSRPLEVSAARSGKVSRFAHALGFDSVVGGRPFTGPIEQGRSVAMRRFLHFAELQAVATDTSTLIVADEAFEETRLTITYVLSELFRNVVQHSGDPLGGIVAAQLMRAGEGGYSRNTIQVAVADTGMGIPKSLSGHHPDVSDPQAALEHALWPHVSGAFPHGQSGSSDNAGLGLFFIAEMAKRTAGRLVIASRGATLVLVGAEDPELPSGVRLLDTGYPGTLVAFELALDEVKDHAALIATIQSLAIQRTPQRTAHRWLSHEPPPPGVPVHAVARMMENTEEALRFARAELEPRLLQRLPVALDFAGMRICTQSFTHALLFEALRLAWARRARIHVVNAEPAVRSSLRLLESYALGG